LSSFAEDAYICKGGNGMKKTIAAFLMFLGSLGMVLAQSGEEEMLRLKQQAGSVVMEEGADSPEAELREGEEQKPGHWNFSVGTSFAYMKGYGSGMMFYTAPAYTLALNKRWSLHGGVVASHYQGLNYTPQGEMAMPGSFNSLAVFVAGSYRMNEKLILHGTGIKQLLSAPVTPFTPYPMDNISLGATYKLGDNITIGASINMRNYNGYQLGYPASPNFGNFGNPFYPSPFGF
jgi:hypothetical protein